MKRTDNQLLINKTKMNMNSGNLQVKRSPESIPRTLGNFLAGLSGKVLMLSAFMVVWTFSGQTLLNAQCAITPVEGTVATSSWTLSPNASCVTVNDSTLVLAIPGIGANGAGCGLYWSATAAGAGEFLTTLPFTVCCDGMGDFAPGDTVFIYADDDGTVDASTAGPVMLIVDLEDNTPPIIDPVDNRAPADGASFTIYTGERYRVDANTDVVDVNDPLPTDLCNSILRWAHPDYSDNCLLDSLFITFTGDSILTPTAVPDDIAIAGNGAILALNGNLVQPSGVGSNGPREFFSSNTALSGVTHVNIRLVDVQGNESELNFSVTVLDTIAPVFSMGGVVYNEFTTDSTCTFIIDDNDTMYDAIAEDNCGVVSLTHDYAPAPFDTTLAGAEFPLDTTIVTWTAVDAAGNMTSIMDTFVVVDNVDPFFTFCPDDITVGTSEDGLDNYDCFYTAGVEFDATADDNCGVETVYHNSDLVADSTSLENARFGLGDHTIVWTAVDSSGNEETCTFTITVIDDEDPMINDCPSDITVFTDNSSCDKIVSWSPPIEFMDNCALDSFGVEGFTADGDPMNIWNTPTGNCNNTVGFTGAFSPDLWDTTFTADGGFNPFWNNQGFSVLYGFDTGSEFQLSVQVPFDYSGLLSFHLFYDIFPSPADSGSNTMVIDVDGTSETYVVSSTGGIVSETAFITVSVSPGSIISISSELFFSGAIERGDAIVSINSLNFVCATSQSNAEVSLGDNLVRYTLVDNAGNSDTCEFTITLEDNDPPVAIAQDVTVAVGSGQPSVNVPASAFNVSSYDNCGIDSMYLSWNPVGTFITVDCSNVGDTIDIDFIVCDAAMNCDTAQVKLVVVEDAIPVTAFCPADQVVNTDMGVCEANVSYPTPRVHDGCSADSSMVLLDGLASGSAFPLGVTPVTWYHVGKNTGDTVLCQFNVVVSDNQAPTIADCPADITQPKDAGSCSAEVTWTEPTATDNCSAPGDILVIQNHFPGDEFPVGKTTVQYTFIDEAGNPAQCVFDITIEDPEIPFVLCRDYTVELDSCGELVVYANDIRVSAEADCGIATLEIEINGEGFNIDSVVLDCNYLGVNNAVFRATTKAGISNTCEATVTVIDVIAPEVVCHDDITVLISDYDDTICTVTGILGIDFEYIDCNGLPTQAGQYYSNDSCNVVTEYTIADEFGSVINGGPFTGPASFDPGTEIFQLGDNVVTVTVTDANGLSDQCVFTVTVVDDVDPIVICPEDIVQDNDEGECGAIVDFQAIADDNCSIDTTFYSQNPGTFFPVGTTTVVFTGIDGSGNESSCSFDVTVEDNEDPVITCADNAYRTTSQDGVIGDCFYIASGGEFDPVFTSDNCEIASVVHDFAAPSDTTLNGAEFPGFCEETVVTWTVTDIYGNFATCQIVITVEDDEDPEFLTPDLTNTPGQTCGDTVRLVNITNNCHAELIVNRPTLLDTDDNCSDPLDMNMTEEISDASVAANVAQNHPWNDQANPSSMELDFPVGITSITWVVYDQVCPGNEPNTDTCVLTIIVEDTEAPVITCPSPQTIYSICAETEVPNYIGSVQIIDNCPNYSISQDPAPGTTLGHVGVALEDGATFQVTMTVSQPTYNANFDDFVVTCDFTITLVDQDVWTPSVGLPGGFLATTEYISCNGESIVITAPTATKPDPNDCSNIMTTNGVLTSSNDNFVHLGNGQYQLEIGTYNISWIYDGGPVNQLQQINVVPDYIPPVAVCQNITVELDGNGEATIDAEQDIDNGSTDNCGIASYALDVNSFTCADLGLNTVTLTVTDLDGNTDECDADVLVVDNIEPMANCVDQITVFLDGDGQASITVDDVDNNSTDNCTITSRVLSQTEFNCDHIGVVSSNIIAEGTYCYSNNDNVVFTYTGDGPLTLDIISGITETNWDFLIVYDGADGAGPVLYNASGNHAGESFTSTGNSISFRITADASVDCQTGAPTPLVWTVSEEPTEGVAVTLTVTDQSNNSSQCVTNVVVVDEIAPVALCQDVTVFLNQDGVAVLGDDSNGPIDGCTSDQFGQWPGAIQNLNTSGSIQTLTTCAFGSEFSLMNVSTPGVYRFASSVTTDFITIVRVADFTIVASGISPVDAEISASGQYRFYRHLDDTCPATSGGCRTVTAQFISPVGGSDEISVLDNGSSDNCEIVEYIESQSIFTCANVGDNNVTLTVVDQSGNSSQCVSVVTVEDNIAPDFTCPESIVTCIAEQVIVADAAFDACGIASALYAATGATSFNGAGYVIDEKFMPGVTSITYTVTDVNDNVTTCTFEVNVDDDLLPVAVCQSNVIAPLGPDGFVTLPATLVDLGSFDIGCDIEDEEGIHISFIIHNDSNGTQDLAVDYFTFNCHNIGSNDVTMVVTDNAWNSSVCNTIVTIQDNTPPVAVCNEDPIEIYVNNGEEFVSVDDVDAGSTDNSEPCFDLSFEIQGNGFTLEDVGTQTVVLLVTDAAGNFSTCSATVEVLSGVPTAVCIADPISVFLDADGLASITADDIDAGSFDPENEDITLSINPSTFTCSDAGMNIVVTLTVTDPHGNSDQCEAVVMVIDNLVPVAICQNVTIELDANGQASTSAEAVDNGSFDNCGIGSLELSQTDFDCSHVGANDVVLTVTDNNGNVETCDAVVTVEDNISPTFVCDDELTLVLNNQGLGSIVPADVLETSVSDNCGIDEMILSQSEFDCTDLGYNHVTLTVFDVNGNFSQCEFSLFVTVAGGVCPEIALIAEDVSGAEGDVVCIPVTVENFEDVTGVQFSLEVVDPAVAVVLGIQELGLTDVVANVIGNTVTVSWFESIDNAVTLNDGDAILCVEVELVGEVGDMTGAIITDDPVAIELTQGLNVVPISVFSGTVTIDAEAEMADIGGLIATEYGFGIEGVDVNVTGDVVTTLVTDADGNYDATVLLGSDVTLTPYKNDNHSQGVTTMDLISIQRHLLLIQALDSPYKLIAADVSNDGVLSTFDLVILQALIIGNITEFPNNTSWRFIDADFSFTDPSNPFADVWPEYISLTDVNAASLDNDFVAIKIGDVNESIGLHGAQTRGNFNFLIEDRAYQAGDLVKVGFNANNFVNMTGYQFTLDYDYSSLEFVGFENAGNVDNLTDANVNAVESGLINLNWYNALSNSLNDGAEVFTLTFRAKSNISAISQHIDVSQSGLNAEAYTVNDDRMNLDIEFFTSAIAGNEFILYQNIPNPFSGETVIGFELPSASSATIEIIDETGKLIRAINQNFEQGYNEIRVGIRDLSGSGVYFYRLTTAEHSAVKSMILVD